MQRFVIDVLAVGLLGAGTTVALVDRYIDQRIESTAVPVSETSASVLVAVAKENLPIGKKITRSDLLWQPWPKEGVQNDFLSAPKPDNRKLKEIAGAVVRRGIIKGTPITKQAVFKSVNPGFLAGALDFNMRAMAIAVSAQSGAAGFILPGDRVDVILIQNVGKKTRNKDPGSLKIPRTFYSHVAEIILQNVRVLASDQKVSDFEKKSKVDLPKRRLNYRIEPKIVASTKGQGGLFGAGGISVPVIASGPWDNISYKPDLAGAIGGLAKDPAKALKSLKNLIPGRSSGGSSIPKLPIPDPGKLLKGLFGR